MKLPLLVFSLVVLYWACIICAEENVNSKRDVINSDEEYVPDYQDVFWERSLSRNKRSVISSISDLLLKALGKSTSLMLRPVLKLFEPVLDLCDFLYGALIGKNTCPKVENLTIALIAKSILIHPIQTIKTVVCYIFDLIGSGGRQALRIMIDKAIVLTKKVLLPGLHRTLNIMKDTLPLPASIVAMIDAFNAVYAIMKLLGYVG